jgi:hypothetical protein
MERDLLDKYFAGRCSPKEEAIVKQWLERPVSVREYSLLDRVWGHIETRSFFGRRNYFNRGWMSLAAASVSILLIMSMAFNLLGPHYVIRNTSSDYEEFDAKGIRFGLPPDAAVSINTGIVSYEASLRFCGGIRINNTSGNNVSMKLKNNCNGDEPTVAATVMTARKDGKYLVFQHHFKSDEFIVVEEDRVFDLPLPLQRKAFEILEI